MHRLIDRRRFLKTALFIPAVPAIIRPASAQFFPFPGPGRAVIVGGGGGNPTTIFGPNLLAWFKADVGLTLSGANVTAAADQSGNGVNCNNGGFGSPDYSATSFNGGPGITFASTDALVSSAFNAASTAATFWAVFNIASGSDRMFSYHNPAAADFSPTDSALVSRALNSTALQVFYRSVSANSKYAVSTNYRYIVVMNGTNQTAYLNGTQSAQITTATPATLGGASHKLFLGKNNNGNGPVFTAAEWGMAKQDGTSTITTLDNYLKTKWGL